MNRTEFKNALETLAAAWTNRDYKKVISFFADNICYSDPLRYSFDNKQGLLDFFQADEGHEQKCVVRAIIFDEAEQMGAFEYTYEGTNLYHGVALIKISNEKIARWREYQHVSQIDWQDFWAGNTF